MDIRIKALLQGSVMTAVGALLYFKFHHRIGPYLVWFLAALVVTGGLAVPPLFRAIEAFGQKLGVWVAKGLTYALLVPFYLLVFAPAHLLLVLRGVDPMNRRFPGTEATYWVPRRRVDAAQYKKQH